MPLSKHLPILITLTLITIFALTPTANAATPAFGSRPNIIILITDDQGYFDLSCHGHPFLSTPHLDKLHTQSTRFTRFHVSPTCAPTRAAMMSGRAPFYVGVTHTILERERMKLGVPTMPEMLRDAGYTTAIFGKWHLGDQAPYRPDKRGFDEVFIHGAGGIGQSYKGSCGDAPKNKYFNPWVLHNNKFVKTKGFCTDVFYDQAISWIDNVRKKDKPFFCYIPTNAPHGPFIAPESYKKKFIKRKLPKRSVGFYGMIENIDDNVGKLMKKLDDWKLAQNTIVIFMTDNGPAATTYNGNHKGRKGSVDEGGTRVPFFIRWPGKFKPGLDIDRIARHIDILPTFAAIIGATPKEQDKLHGRNLVPLLKDPKTNWPDRFLFFHKGRWRGKPETDKLKNFAVRSQRYRLVGPNQLYDLTTDPSQKKNLIDKHPDIAEKMLNAYKKWWTAALPNMVNENAPLKGPNTFHQLFYKQFPNKK